MGPGEPGVPQVVRYDVRAGCERRTGTLVRRSHARYLRAGNRRAAYRSHRGHRCRGQTSRRYGAHAGHPRPETAAGVAEPPGAIYVWDSLPAVTVPTLVIHGRDDARVPYAQGRALAT